MTPMGLLSRLKHEVKQVGLVTLYFFWLFRLLCGRRAASSPL